ncbi:hypothetical protein EVAR_8897_1 [Eumeta japonica]|uniref:Uncharacterized protein n=1 Tax=Eumeta variegata TaxID=151549 RepID=A0A4C1U0I2_EUMVA|nr:hypothetical protein EVAR_8897_1 [Eumeta japonica]
MGTRARRRNSRGALNLCIASFAGNSERFLHDNYCKKREWVEERDREVRRKYRGIEVGNSFKPGVVTRSRLSTRTKPLYIKKIGILSTTCRWSGEGRNSRGTPDEQRGDRLKAATAGQVADSIHFEPLKSIWL